MPKISVVLPVYNAEKYLTESLESLSNQTFRDFEIIAINDGSTDNSLKILQEYAKKEPRLHLISRENKKLIATLNEGIKMARGSYVARMDADDICDKRRFEEQLKYLEETNADICGSWIRCFGKSSNIKKFPLSFEEIKVDSLFMCPFAHPSVLIRRKVFQDLKYELNDIHAEDLGLWIRAIMNGYKLVNIPKILLNYRVSDNQISIKYKDIQKENAFRLRKYYRDNYILFKSLYIPNLVLDYSREDFYNELSKAITALNYLQQTTSMKNNNEFLVMHTFKMIFYASGAFSFLDNLKLLKKTNIKKINKLFLVLSRLLNLSKFRKYYLNIYR